MLLVPLVNTIQSILMYVISQEVVAGSLAFVDVVAIHMTSVGLYRRFMKFTWNTNRHSRHLQGTFRVQVAPNCAHLHLFRELTS